VGLPFVDDLVGRVLRLAASLVNLIDEALAKRGLLATDGDRAGEDSMLDAATARRNLRSFVDAYAAVILGQRANRRLSPLLGTPLFWQHMLPPSNMRRPYVFGKCRRVPVNRRSSERSEILVIPKSHNLPSRLASNGAVSLDDIGRRHRELPQAATDVIRRILQ
jgi:hypothetical protein